MASLFPTSRINNGAHRLRLIIDRTAKTGLKIQCSTALRNASNRLMGVRQNKFSLVATMSVYLG